MDKQEIKIKVSCFLADQICGSGQCFRMTALPDGGYRVIAADRLLELRQEKDGLLLGCTQQEYDGFWRRYFDLDADYGAVLSSIDPRDRYLSQVSEFGSGIRILNQDLWEMIVTFIISQQNNIKRIRKCIETICTSYGEEKYSSQGICYHAFPTPDRLACATEEELRSLGLGYRSRYLVNTSASVAAGDCDLDKIRQMEYPQAREELMKLSGVGGKVADCICLFALHHLDAFPVDTHIRQVLETHYPDGFPQEQYRGSMGILQQYIFYYDLMK